MMILSGQNYKNDRYSTRMPILLYTWLLLFIIFCAQFLIDNVTNFVIPIILMSYILLIFVYKTIKER